MVSYHSQEGLGTLPYPTVPEPTLPPPSCHSQDELVTAEQRAGDSAEEGGASHSLRTLSLSTKPSADAPLPPCPPPLSLSLSLSPSLPPSLSPPLPLSL